MKSIREVPQALYLVNRKAWDTALIITLQFLHFKIETIFSILRVSMAKNTLYVEMLKMWNVLLKVSWSNTLNFKLTFLNILTESLVQIKHP